MKKLLLIFAILVSPVFADEIDDLFGGGDDGFEFERFSNESILLEIDTEAKVACKKGLCTLHAMENKYGEFQVSFNVGEGSPSGGDGVNVYTGGYSNCSDCDRSFWGFTVKYIKGKCTQTVKVPKSVYYALNRYMFGLLNTDGTSRRGFTPADEAMIMFYTTIMDNVKGCQR